MTGESDDRRYELRHMPLARGVMGEVWLGWDRERGREVAVKFPRVPRGADPAEMARRFRREAAITAGLNHPGIPAVHHRGSAHGWPYLVMERVPGTSVSDLLAAHGRLSVGSAATIAARTCGVLATVHEASLVHRDVKPANLMLRPDGTVTLLDFGLAEYAGSMTGWPRNVTGTPAYPAPEHRHGSGGGARADLYGLGRSLHEMLSGRRPDRPWNAQLTACPEVPPGVSPAVGEVLNALCAADPVDRPHSARDVHRALLRLAPSLEGTGTGGDPDPPPPTGRSGRLPGVSG